MKTHEWLFVVVLVGLCILQVGCTGKVIVTKVPAPTPGNQKEDLEGVFYALPRTVIKVAVPIERSQSIPGVYAEYTELFFPDPSHKAGAVKDSGSGTDTAKPADKTQKQKFALGKPVFTTVGEPDLSKLYYVKFVGSGAVDRTASIDYTEQGTVSGVQGGADNYTTDVILSAVNAAAGIASRVAFGSATDRPKATPPKAKECPENPSDDDEAVYDFFVTDNNAKEIFYHYCELGDPASRKKIQNDVAAAKADWNSPLSKAFKAYKDIADLTSKRRDLITQTGVGAPLPSLEVMLKEIDALLTRNMATYFTGQTKKDTWTPAFELRPLAVNDPPIALLSIDETGGVCLIQSLPPQDEATDGFLSKDGCKEATAKTVRVRFALNGTDQVFMRVQGAFEETGDRSFRYLIPAAAIATLEIGGTGSAECLKEPGCKRGGAAALSIGQFGAEVSLPASSGGRSVNYTLKFFEATGALKSFSLASKAAIQAATVNSLTTTANSALDAKNKQAAADAAKADQLAKLDRQAKILQDQATIEKLCVQLQVSCEP